jgi:glucosamine-phosphate N-acetyltransferase
MTFNASRLPLFDFLPVHELNHKAQNTTMAAAADAGLFSADLISPDVSANLPEGYKLRALRRADYNGGFLDCLRVLTTVGDVSEEAFGKQYDDMLAQGSYYIVVIEDTSRTENPVVATGALITEKKL